MNVIGYDGWKLVGWVVVLLRIYLFFGNFDFDKFLTVFCFEFFFADDISFIVAIIDGGITITDNDFFEGADVSLIDQTFEVLTEIKGRQIIRPTTNQNEAG